MGRDYLRNRCTTHHHACDCREADFHNLAVATRRWAAAVNQQFKTGESGGPEKMQSIYNDIADALNTLGYETEDNKPLPYRFEDMSEAASRNDAQPVTTTAIQLGGLNVECNGMTDNLAIVLASYFEGHLDRPDDDPIDDEYGWSEWTLKKSNEALEYLAEQLSARRSP